MPSVGGIVVPSVGGIVVPSVGGIVVPSVGGIVVPSVGGVVVPSVGGVVTPGDGIVVSGAGLFGSGVLSPAGGVSVGVVSVVPVGAGVVSVLPGPGPVVLPGALGSAPPGTVGDVVSVGGGVDSLSVVLPLGVVLSALP